MKRFIKGFLGIGLVATAIGGFFTYDFYIQDRLDTTPVVVAKDNIGFKDKITEENLEVKKIKRDQAISNAYDAETVKDVLDKNASIDIAEGTQLYPSLVDDFDLVPNEDKGEFIASVPEQWIFSVAGSMRSSYVADFYAVKDNEAQELRAVVEENEDEEEGEKEATNEVTNSREPILQDVKVSSVRDSSNTEVTDNENNESTGSITNVEFVADEAMLDTMREYTENGYKLYIVYQYGR